MDEFPEMDYNGDIGTRGDRMHDFVEGFELRLDDSDSVIAWVHF